VSGPSLGQLQRRTESGGEDKYSVSYPEIDPRPCSP